jgi:hypothetical protein
VVLVGEGEGEEVARWEVEKSRSEDGVGVSRITPPPGHGCPFPIVASFIMG